MFCKGSSVARKKYQADMMRLMAGYVVLVFSSALVVKHRHMNSFFMYFWAVLPAVPVLAVIARMGSYLRTEKDEYQKLLIMQSLLVGTAALLGTLVVNDFLRAFASSEGLPPFASFVIFCVGMGIAQVVQKLQNKAGSDE